MTPRQDYIARINRVIDHIDAHLAETLDLGTLAEVAHFSPWHFHRLFLAMTGETLADRVRRRRLEVAAARLQATPPEAALAIALDVGFGSAEVFTRAFRAHFGVTPSAWRRGAHRLWADAQRARLSKIHQAQRKPDQAAAPLVGQDSWAWPSGPADPDEGANMNVQYRTLPETRVAYMRQVGPYGDPAIGRLWERFSAWSEQQFPGPRPTMYGISQDSADLTSPDKCCYDACAPVDAKFKASGEIGVQTLPGGRYACVPFKGTGADIHAAWMKLFSVWLPDSGQQIDNRPCVEIYGKDFAMDAKTGVFNCELCLPVRAM